MQIITQKYYSNINNKLTWYVDTIRNDNVNGYQDANRDAEDVFCYILNVIYDYQLENLNKKIENNFSGIDLGDDKNRISVQVTSDNSSKKIKNTLKSFLCKNYIDSYDRLIILIIGEKLKYKTNFNSGSLSFDPKKDIIGKKELMIEINKLPEEKLQKISEYIDHMILFGISEKDIGRAFLKKQHKTVYWSGCN